MPWRSAQDAEKANETVAWQKEYNEERPHSSSGYRTPKEFATQAAAASFGRTGVGQEASTTTNCSNGTRLW